MADKLKKWMRKEDIYDNDLYDILSSQGIADPETDFKEYTQSSWDTLWTKGCVERAKELKDQKAKVRLEKKMTKIEKHWRKESGLKSTSIKKKTKKKSSSPNESSASSQSDALKQGASLKKHLQKENCYSVDLLMVCVGMGITSHDDLDQIDSNASYYEIDRQVRVLRAKELKSNAARMRMEKQMAKFEKLWRAKTGIKKTSIKSKKNKKKKKQDPKSAANDEMGSKGAKLKKWMRKNDVWEMALYDELMNNGITDPDQLKQIKETKFDDIVRKVRVDRFAQLKDQSARNRADKLLVKFEKQWRAATGIKKSSLKKK